LVAGWHRNIGHSYLKLLQGRCLNRRSCTNAEV